MSCREGQRWLDTFFDGELEGRVMRDAALHVTRCSECAAALREQERLQGLLQATIRGELDEIAARPGADSFWAAIEAGIASNVDANGARAGDSAGAAGRRAARARSSIDASASRSPTRRADRSDDRPPARRVDRPAARSYPGRRRGVRRAITGLALAASTLIAIYATLDGAGRPGSVGSDRIASAPERARFSAGSPDSSLSRVATGGANGTTLARGPVHVAAADAQRALRQGRDGGLRLASETSIGLAEPSPARSNQIQIESMDYSGRSLAMWSEPGTETTVIWVDDDAPGPAAAPGSVLLPVAPGGSGRNPATREVSSHFDGPDQVEFPR